MYEEENKEEPGTFAIFFAEGETLAKQGEYQKAIESFTKVCVQSLCCIKPYTGNANLCLSPTHSFENSALEMDPLIVFMCTSLEVGMRDKINGS